MDDLIIKITAYDLLVMEEVSQDSVDDDMPSYIYSKGTCVCCK